MAQQAAARLAGGLLCIRLERHARRYVAGCAGLFVNGQAIGRQGGFDPYELGVRCERYAVENPSEGRNLIEIRVDHAGEVPPLMVDAVAHGSDGAERHLWSDGTWKAMAGGDPLP